MAASSSDDDFVADINVTPFVDVMLVLLIIFMVTAPMMTEGLDVALPKVESSEVLPTEDDHCILTIKAEGKLYLDEYETGLDDLIHVVTTAVKNQGKQLFVRADKNVPYGIVMQVMDRLRGAGIADVGLVTTSAFDNSEEKQSEQGGEAPAAGSAPAQASDQSPAQAPASAPAGATAAPAAGGV